MFCSIHDILLKESNDDGNTSKLLECFLAVNPDISVVSDCKGKVIKSVAGSEKF